MRVQRSAVLYALLAMVVFKATSEVAVLPYSFACRVLCTTTAGNQRKVQTSGRSRNPLNISRAHMVRQNNKSKTKQRHGSASTQEKKSDNQANKLRTCSIRNM